MNTRIVTTPEEIKAANLISVWGNPDTKLNTQFGLVSYREWCERDAERIRGGGGQAIVLSCSNWLNEKTGETTHAKMVCIAKE